MRCSIYHAMIATNGYQLDEQFPQRLAAVLSEVLRSQRDRDNLADWLRVELTTRIDSTD